MVPYRTGRRRRRRRRRRRSSPSPSRLASSPTGRSPSPTSSRAISMRSSKHDARAVSTWKPVSDLCGRAMDRGRAALPRSSDPSLAKAHSAFPPGTFGSRDCPLHCIQSQPHPHAPSPQIMMHKHHPLPTSELGGRTSAREHEESNRQAAPEGARWVSSVRALVGRSWSGRGDPQHSKPSYTCPPVSKNDQRACGGRRVRPQGLAIPGASESLLPRRAHAVTVGLAG